MISNFAQSLKEFKEASKLEGLIEGEIKGKQEDLIEGEIKGKQEGLIEGEIKGKQQGLIEGKCEVAKNMLAKFDDQMIVDITGISLEVVQELRREQDRLADMEQDQ